MSRIKWVLVALLLVVIAAGLYYMGGEQSLERVETPVELGTTGAA